MLQSLGSIHSTKIVVKMESKKGIVNYTVMFACCNIGSSQHPCLSLMKRNDFDQTIPYPQVGYIYVFAIWQMMTQQPHL